MNHVIVCFIQCFYCDHLVARIIKVIVKQMVVLEEGGMLTTGHNQYLQPDYLSPLPTTVSTYALLNLLCFKLRD